MILNTSPLDMDVCLCEMLNKRVFEALLSAASRITCWSAHGTRRCTGLARGPIQ